MAFSWPIVSPIQETCSSHFSVKWPPAGRIAPHSRFRENKSPLDDHRAAVRETAAMRQRNKPKRKSPKNVLRLPDLDHSKSSVLQSLGSPASKRTYGFAIDDFISWYCSEPRLAFGRTVVLRYRYELESRQLAPATINLRLAAVRRLAYEASDNGLLSPDLAASIRRVKGAKRLGIRLGNWLTPAQGKKLLNAPRSEENTFELQSLRH